MEILIRFMMAFSFMVIIGQFYYRLGLKHGRQLQREEEANGERRK
jgi:hypothetical protein